MQVDTISHKFSSLHMLVALWLLALLVLGAYLRMHGVGEYYYSLDEMSHLSIAKAPIISQVAEYSKFETHPPYPHILRHFLMSISDAPSVVRGMSVACGLLCILIYYAVGRQLGGVLTGCVAAYLVTFGYGNILLSQVVRNYTLLAMFGGLAFLSYQTFLRTQKTLWLLLYGAFALLMLMTHYSAVFAIVCMGIGGSVCLYGEDKDRKALYGWIIIHAMLGAYFSGIYMTEIRHNNYSAPFLLNAKIAAESPPYNSLLFRLQLFAAYIPATASYFLHATYANPISIAAAILFISSLVALLVTSRQRALCYETILALMLGALLLAANIYPYAFRIGGRHAIWALPYVILPVSIFLGQVLQKIRSKLVIFPVAAILLVVGITLNPASQFFSDVREYQLRETQKQQLDNLIAGMEDGDIIVTGGVNAMYLLPENVNFYRVLTQAPDTAWHYSVPLAHARLEFYDPMRMPTLTLREFILRLEGTGELKNIHHLWIFNTMFNSVMKRPECVGLASARLSFPAGDNQPLLELVGIPREVLTNDVIPPRGRYASCIAP